MRKSRTLVLALVGTLAAASLVHAHATYNLSGNTGPGIGGSTPPGATDDGSVTNNAATWTNGGVADYGILPVNWYSGMHSTTQVRTIQAGTAPNPPSGSLLQQVNNFNAANDPDFPTDRVLAVGGASWSDPTNGNQGWGMGLDYGLIHFSPIDTLLSQGPLKFTVTLQDDPTDAVATRLAFAIYGGWDTGTTSSRHQTFVTSPAPVNNPLGSTGLTLIDYVVATSAGATLSRTYDLTTTYGGEYTILVGALGGVSGQYQLTVTTAPDTTLTQCLEDLGSAGTDADGDGIIDQYDTCADTPATEGVDQSGCSLVQFCGTFDVSTRDGQKICKKVDWKNDEPIAKKKEYDCIVDKGPRGTQPEDYRCIPAPLVP